MDLAFDVVLYCVACVLAGIGVFSLFLDACDAQISARRRLALLSGVALSTVCAVTAFFDWGGRLLARFFAG